MDLKQYTQPDIAGQRIILRADLDVSAGETDSLRLERLVPTIQDLLALGAKQIVIIGHRGRPAFAEASAGRPEGRITADFSLKPVRDHLVSLLVRAGIQDELTLVADIASDPAGYNSQRLLMLENLRCWPGEKTADKNFVQQLARWGEVYVNDAFSVCHRTDASMLALPQGMPKIFVGLGLVNEVKHLSEYTENPVHPYAVVLGGAKIETKLPLIKSFLNKADIILLGGGLANTFFKAQGWEIGKSLVDDPFLDEARSLLNPKLLLPIDVTITNGQGAMQSVPVTAVPADGFIGDIGPKTVALYKENLTLAKMILFNGPMGKFEDEIYSHGTKDLVEAIIGSQAKTLTGGGDTLDLVQSLGVADQFSFVSVGGGAMLTFLAGEPMPALEVLTA